MGAVLSGALLVTGCASPGSGPSAQTQASSGPTVSGGEISTPLTPVAGDPARGRAVLVDRRVGLCLLCHSGPFPEERFQGTLAPDLAGAGQRWSAGQLRLRLVDPQRLNPESIMPAYHRVTGLSQVGGAWQGKPLLSAQQIEDVIALLVTLK